MKTFFAGDFNFACGVVVVVFFRRSSRFVARFCDFGS